jgi:hypothetical protein
MHRNMHCPQAAIAFTPYTALPTAYLKPNKHHSHQGIEWESIRRCHYSLRPLASKAVGVKVARRSVSAVGTVGTGMMCGITSATWLWAQAGGTLVICEERGASRTTTPHALVLALLMSSKGISERSWVCMDILHHRLFDRTRLSA